MHRSQWILSIVAAGNRPPLGCMLASELASEIISLLYRLYVCESQSSAALVRSSESCSNRRRACLRTSSGELRRRLQRNSGRQSRARLAPKSRLLSGEQKEALANAKVETKKRRGEECRPVKKRVCRCARNAQYDLIPRLHPGLHLHAASPPSICRVSASIIVWHRKTRLHRLTAHFHWISPRFSTAVFGSADVVDSESRLLNGWPLNDFQLKLNKLNVFIC